LKQLYSISEFAEQLIFKGGTSLSKSYNLIDRFSEDCDITFDRSLFGNLNDPTEKDISGKEKERRINTIVNAANSFVKDTVLPKLSQKLAHNLPAQEKWSLEIDEKDRLTILFAYPVITGPINSLH